MFRASLFLAAVLCIAPPAPADDFRLAMGAGVFDFINDQHTEPVVSLEVRLPITPPAWAAESFLGFAPTFGVLAHADEGSLTYGMITLSFASRDRRTELNLSAGLGVHERGDRGLDLGSTALFLLGATANWQMDNGTWVGLSYRHASNGNLQKPNPGVNTPHADMGSPVYAEVKDRVKRRVFNKATYWQWTEL